jgi:hypothetical protein
MWSKLESLSGCFKGGQLIHAFLSYETKTKAALLQRAGLDSQLSAIQGPNQELLAFAGVAKPIEQLRVTDGWDTQHRGMCQLVSAGVQRQALFFILFNPTLRRKR